MSILPASPSSSAEGQTSLARRLGLFDAIMIVMGGIIGAGIFVNPAVVARQVHSVALTLGAWAIGGIIALIGAFIYAELAELQPAIGGQYAYLRDAFHPLVAFLYGWALLLVIQTGGMAGAAIIFGRYFRDLTGIGVPEQALAVILLVALTLVNCGGVRAGSNVQSGLMLTKLAAIAILVLAGLSISHSNENNAPPLTALATPDTITGLARAMVPVIFAYGGWQTASFISGEMRNSRKDLPRGLLIGVSGVVLCYVLVAAACLRVLGQAGLAHTQTPASDVMRFAWGENGARLIAAGIAISTAGFLSQSILTAPRVYYAMARDGVFFQSIGWVNPRTRVPVVAIGLQGVLASIIALTGKYDQILNYVVSIDVLFFGLTGASLFVFRRRSRESPRRIHTLLHPFSTIFFILACWAISVSTIVQFPRNALVGLALLALGALVFLLWKPATWSGRS